METYKASDFAKAGVFPRRVSAEGPLASLGTASLLASFGTAHREVFPRRASLFVLPRRASAEGPLACARGDKKGGSG
jgi:hypothetical protein